MLQQPNNVFLVVSGHENGIALEDREAVGTEDHHDGKLLVDYQFYEIPAVEFGPTGIYIHITRQPSFRTGSVMITNQMMK